MTSSSVAMPPTPITGMVTRPATCQTRRKASGLIAGPLKPPVTLPSTGCQRGQPRLPANELRHLNELVFRCAGNIADDGGRQAPQVRQMMAEEMLDAVIVQPDRVKHARGGLDRTWRWVPRPRLARDRFGN